MIACYPERTVVVCDVCGVRREVLLPMRRRHALRELSLRGWGEKRLGKMHSDQVCPGCAEKQQQRESK